MFLHFKTGDLKTKTNNKKGFTSLKQQQLSCRSKQARNLPPGMTAGKPCPQSKGLRRRRVKFGVGQKKVRQDRRLEENSIKTGFPSTR